MRKAAGIILITLGALSLFGLIWVVAVFGIKFFLAPFLPGPQGLAAAVTLLGLVVAAAFHITGGILCLRRKYWGVCLASASFAILSSVVNSGGLLLSSNVYTSWPIWVMLVVAVIAVIFILRTKKEWQETSDIMDYKASNDG
jgi:hypothetical protein